MTRDIACGAAGLILAASYYWLADQIPHSLLDDPTGSSGLPKLLAFLVGALSAALIVVSLVRRAAAGEGRGVHAHLRAAGLLGLGVLYLLVLPWLGYLATILVFLLAVSLYAGVRVGMAPVAVSVVGGFVLWGLFVRVFGIPMPAGAWFG